MSSKTVSILAAWTILVATGAAVARTLPLDGSTQIVRQHPGDLTRDLRALADKTDEAFWVAWTVPMIEGDHELCCFREEHGRRSKDGCRLDNGSLTISRGAEDDSLPSPVDHRLVVLVRMRGRRIQSVRAYRDDCRLHCEGTTTYVLDSVAGEESAAFLSSVVEKGKEDPAEGALAALAFHDASRVGDALERFTTLDYPVEIRRDAAFWLAVSRGDDAFPTLDRLVTKDPSVEVREGAIFAMAQLETPQATDRLLFFARESKSADVRKAALFWLGQRAGEQIAGAIDDAIRDDPDVEVKEAAVFALSQLPADVGIPKLIRIAETHRHLEVRRQAMFWLGESGDPRALEFFEQVLAD